MGIVLYAVEESDLAEAFDALVCGDACEHLVHDGNLWYYRLTDEEREDIRERATLALAASTLGDSSGDVLYAVVERYKAEKQA